MTDQVTSTYDVLEALINQYDAGIESPAGSTAFLEARSELQSKRDLLTTSQDQALAKLDRKLAGNAARVSTQLGEMIRDSRGSRPSSEWWWYLDVVSPASDFLGGRAPSRNERIINTLLNIFMVAALLIALFVLARNLNLTRFIPFLNTPVPTVPAALPSFTPAPTATLDAQGLDFSTAKVVTTQADVLQISLPAGWGETPNSRFGEWTYGYPIADPAAAQTGEYPVSISVILNTAAEVYGNVLGLTESVSSPDDAFRKFKAQAAAQPNSTLNISDPVASKIGTLDASALIVSIPAQSATVELRAANVEGGRVALVFSRYGNGYADQFKPLLEQIIGGIVLKPSNIPTPTPTATLFPLEITATALQAEFIKLTPTATATVAATATGGTPAPAVTTVATDSAATTAATVAATTGATSVATSAATLASTTAATVEGTTAVTAVPTAAATTVATSVATTAATSAATP